MENLFRNVFKKTAWDAILSQVVCVYKREHKNKNNILFYLQNIYPFNYTYLITKLKRKLKINIVNYKFCLLLLL